MRNTLAILLGILCVAFSATPALAVYDPTTGRFIQRDPGGAWHDRLAHGNAYTYAASNPGRYVDRNGWEATEPSAPAQAQPDPRNDPNKGCGVSVRRAPKHKTSNGKQVGHDWIEIDDPGRPSTQPREGIGFWPRGDDLWNAPSTLYTPKGSGSGDCECKNENDPYTGTTPDKIWEGS